MSLISDALKLTQATHSQPKPVPPVIEVQRPITTPSVPDAPAPPPATASAAATPALLVKMIIVASLAIVSLVLVLTPLLIYRLWPKTDRPPHSAIQPPRPPRSPAVAPAGPAPASVIEQPKDLIPTEQDTTPLLVKDVKPATPATVEPPKLILQGILMDSQSREAMINGILFKEGDAVEGARIISIERKQVKLQFSGREFVLRMQ